MANETEIKIRVESHEPVRRALQQEHAEFLGKVLQTDTFFDSSRGRLRNGDRGLRIRRLQVIQNPLGHGSERRLSLVTYKGPKQDCGEMKVREEIEVGVDDADAAGQLINALGLSEKMVIQKKRASYRLNGCQIELDELPMIGKFVEIEGPDADTLEKMRRRLGLEGPGITTSYSQMLAEARAERGLSEDRAVFE
ncbi:MAG: class IV adenylate cyclase [Phycisphaerae bacterium]